MVYATVTFTGITHGAEGVCRLPDGVVCFVPGVIPGERAEIEITERHKRRAAGRLVRLLEPSPDRVDPPCPLYGRCGGCQLQHVAPERQAQLKRRIVVEQLERLGGFAEPPVAEVVRPGGEGWVAGYRTSARFAADDRGRLGFREQRSRRVVPVDRCLLLAPPMQAARDAAGDGWPPGADVPLRASATEHVRGIPFRVSPGSFFQPGPAGAAALTEQVLAAAAVRPGDRALDLYAGVGLFARALGEAGAEVVAVESNPVACADARVNLRPLGERAGVICAKVELAVRAGAATAAARTDVIVLDPPRRGAGPALCRALARLRPRTVVYVACDPAALARDARALTDAGYPLALAVPVDQFGHTAQIEVVASFHAPRT